MHLTKRLINRSRYQKGAANRRSNQAILWRLQFNLINHLNEYRVAIKPEVLPRIFTPFVRFWFEFTGICPPHSNVAVSCYVWYFIFNFRESIYRLPIVWGKACNYPSRLIRIGISAPSTLRHFAQDQVNPCHGWIVTPKIWSDWISETDL